MSRVDENSTAQRTKERRMEEKRDEKRSQKKAAQFAKLMDAGRKQAAEQSRSANLRDASTASARNREAKQAGRRLAAYGTLLAKQGIQANAFAQRLQREGKGRLAAAYEDRAARGHELRTEHEGRRTEQASQQQEKTELNRQADKLTPISRDQKNDRRGGGFGEQSPGGGGKEQSAAPDVAFGGQAGNDATGATPGATGAPTPGQAPGASSVPPQVQQAVQEIVKRVMTGVDSKGLGVVYIELQEHVLAGAQLTMKSGRRGLSLSVRTGNDNVARLLSSGQTAHELQQALQNKGIHLRDLEVNDNKVVRS